MDIFIDSGIIVHLFDTKDCSSTQFSYSFINSNFENLTSSYSPITTDLVLLEAFNNIVKGLWSRRLRYPIESLSDFYHKIIIPKFTIMDQDIEKYFFRAQEIIKQYKKLKYSFVDAMSLALIEELGDLKVFTVDENWRYFVFLRGYNFVKIDIVDIFSG